ncbi:MAG TPA: hypothetical protein VES39_11605, partial [Rhodospirillales bacterium]|nr:hypothetical protein [Rhodospirillales bacterium]
MPIVKEDDGPRPIDYGFGRGVPLSSRPMAAQIGAAAPMAPSATLPGPSDAHVKGVFGPAFTMPIIPIHAAVLPDGRVLYYGTNEQGQQTGKISYSVWDPKQGTGLAAHMVLPNTTATDLFCSAQSILPGGEMLLTGGDLTIDRIRGFSNNRTTIFNPANNTIRDQGAMAYARWYPSIVSLGNGEKLILGGRENKSTGAIVPEVYQTNGTWRTLSGATSSAAFGATQAFYKWYYPRA